MRAVVLGDIHGRTGWASHAADIAVREGIDTIIQVGDLGIWPGGDATVRFDSLSKRLGRLGITMLVAPGNHEDYDQIDALTPREDGWLPFREHILLAPRGHRTVMGGRHLVWLGGAASVDRGARLASDRWANERYERYGSSKRQHTWWAQEAITEEDVERTVAGGRADIMVSHESPLGVWRLIELHARNRHMWRPEDLEYSNEVRRRFTDAVLGVGPRLLVHGHHHITVDEMVTYSDFECHVVGLAAEGAPGAIAVLDLNTLAIRAAA